jgi:nicotinate-nucleotide adenylyltransferase
MRTIGLFGGSFDPPHVAHLLAAQHALEQLDELWFVPVLVHPGGKRLTGYADRVAMCELAIAPLGPRVRVSRVEEELGREHDGVAATTRDVLELVAARHANTRWRLVMGADLVRTATSWRGWRELVRRAPPIVIARGTRTPDISATQIRAALACRAVDVAAALLPRGVLSYITARQLYAGYAPDIATV